MRNEKKGTAGPVYKPPQRRPRFIPGPSSVMLALWCCRHECTDITELEEKCGIPHSIPYEPGYSRQSTVPVSFLCPNDGCDCGGGGSGEPEPKRLCTQDLLRPRSEMKLERGGHCGFHALTDTKLWTKEPVLLSAQHFRQACSRKVGCSRRQHCFFTKECVSLTLIGGEVHPNHVRRWTVEEKACIKQTFGTSNRYHCFYYRRNADMQDKMRLLGEKEVAERWRRLGSAVGTTVQPGSPNDVFLRGIPEVAPVYSSPTRPYLDHSMEGTWWERPRIGAKLLLDHGMYYWELVNYNHEEALEAVQGGGGRQRRLYIDTQDSSHTKLAHHQQPGSGFDKKRMVYMSLIFRRVIRPSEERSNRYTTVQEFDLDQYPHDVLSRRSLFFSFQDVFDEQVTIEPDFDMREQGFILDHGNPISVEERLEPQMVYQHVNTPMMGLRLFRRIDEKRPDRVLYYRLSMPRHVHVFSVDTDRISVRINLICSVGDIPRGYSRSLVGTSLVRAVNQPWPDVYCFRTHFHEWMDVAVSKRDAHERVFEILYEDEDVARYQYVERVAE